MRLVTIYYDFRSSGKQSYTDTRTEKPLAGKAAERPNSKASLDFSS